MKVHPDKKIERLKWLRNQGYSINEIVEKLSIPKTTVWHHIQNISVDQKYQQILSSKRGGSKARKHKRLQIAENKAKELLNGLNRDLCIAIAMLYWGEGSKKSCEFINSDGAMIRVYLAILKKVLNISDESIKVTVRIFSGMNRKECLNYWKQIVGISKNKFIVRVNDGGTKGKTRYGMCRITIRKGSDALKLIHSLKEQFSEEIINKK